MILYECKVQFVHRNPAGDCLLYWQTEFRKSYLPSNLAIFSEHPVAFVDIAI